jgi:hypothetical protein
MRLNDDGEIVQAACDDLPNRYDCVACDAFVVMPNHVHAIVVPDGISVTDATVGAGLKPAPTQIYANHGLAEIVRAFKTFLPAALMVGTLQTVGLSGNATISNTLFGTSNPEPENA